MTFAWLKTLPDVPTRDEEKSETGRFWERRFKLQNFNSMKPACWPVPPTLNSIRFSVAADRARNDYRDLSCEWIPGRRISLLDDAYTYWKLREMVRTQERTKHANNAIGSGVAEIRRQEAVEES